MMPGTHGSVAVMPPTWHEAIATFKRELIVRALRQSRGNRTRAARTLGLQRTYLLRLMREMGVTVPRPVHRDARLGRTAVPGCYTVAAEARVARPGGRAHVEPW